MMYNDGSGISGRSIPVPAAITTPVPTPATRRWAQALWREPLTHFLAFGILIFIVAHALEARSQRYRIDVTHAQVTRIVNSYTQQYGAAPDPAQVRTMVDNYIREEIFLREGLALGLDQDDEIVRRRIAQKYDFLQQDMAVPREPGETELASWFTRHRADFALPARRSFAQLYYAIDQRGDAAARTLAQIAATRLAHGQPAPQGDDFPGPKVIVNLGQDDIQRVFGGGDFAARVFAAPVGRWSGPYRSGFGWHLLRITDQQPGQQRSLAQAHEEARLAWIQADRRARNAGAYRQLLGHYSITRAQ
jgi:peptidyl-prolyl cis-trans isomerase C